jgi:hypothetical protein
MGGSEVAKRLIVGHANYILETMRDLAMQQGLRVYSTPKEILYVDDWGQCHVALTKLKNGHPWKDVARFQLQQMPGCCAILTMSYVEVDRCNFSFEKAVEFVEQAAKDAAFGSLVLTQVLHKPQPEKHEWHVLVEKHGFVMSEPFINAKSGNKVVYLTKNLGQEGKIEGFEEVFRQ